MLGKQVRMGLGIGLVLACGLAPAGVWGGEPPSSPTDPSAARIGEERFETSPTPAAAEGPRHEAFLASQTGARDREEESTAARVSKRPPRDVAERPGVDPHTPGAQWIGGYWAWDNNRRDYVWLTGTWQVPPPGKFWVNGYWRRDGDGWYRVPGFWSARVDGEREPAWDWKAQGPPNPPVEAVGPPPGPDHFFVAGVYAPNPKGEKLEWTSGVWYPVHPGWEWVPARWVRRSSGWEFHKGWWQRSDPVADNEGQSRTPATTAPPGYPPQIYTRGYNYGPYWGPFGGRFGGFLNQVLP